MKRSEVKQIKCHWYWTCSECQVENATARSDGGCLEYEDELLCEGLFDDGCGAYIELED